MADNQNELFTYKVKAGTRIYYLNVKEDKNGELYLVIKESRLKDDSKEVHRVMVFEKDFKKFVEGFRKTLEFIKTRKSTSSTSSATTTDSDEEGGENNFINAGTLDEDVEELTNS